MTVSGAYFIFFVLGTVVGYLVGKKEKEKQTTNELPFFTYQTPVGGGDESLGAETDSYKCTICNHEWEQDIYKPVICPNCGHKH